MPNRKKTTPQNEEKKNHKDKEKRLGTRERGKKNLLLSTRAREPYSRVQGNTPSGGKHRRKIRSMPTRVGRTPCSKIKANFKGKRKGGSGFLKSKKKVGLPKREEKRQVRRVVVLSIFQPGKVNT